MNDLPFDTFFLANTFGKKLHFFVKKGQIGSSTLPGSVSDTYDSSCVKIYPQ